MQLDDTIVLKYLRAKLPGLGLILPSSCTSSQFKGGQSNPTFLINCDHGAFQLVLRKAPPGPLLKSAHQVDRESTLMQRVKASNPECLVPRIYIIEQNSNILGTKFFLMEFVPGTVHRMPTLPSLAPPLRYALFNNVAAALANIHETPAEVASTPFSASVNDSAAYCRRQISIWTRQFRRSSEHVQSCREMRQLLEWLEANIPEQNIRNPTTRLCLVHGDFRIDNVVCEDQGGTVKAILDWELAGAGDARADLAYFCLGYYLSPEGLLGSFSYQVKDKAGISRLQTGVPTVREFVAAYCKSRKLPESVITPEIESTEWTFFLCLSLYRMASISAGVYTRAVQGNAATGDKALVFREAVPLLAQQAMRLIGTTRGARQSPRQNISLPVIKGPSPRALSLLSKLRCFIDEAVIPCESEISQQLHSGAHKWSEEAVHNPKFRWVATPAMSKLRIEARKRGLWNLWLPQNVADKLKEVHPSWPWDRFLPHNAGLTHQDYAYIAIETGRSVYAAESCNCQAPDTGNMEILATFGTVQQQKRYLYDLLDGTSRSCFGMTEPMVASSDPTSLQSLAQRRKDGGWNLQARKWWTTNACHADCKVCILMAATEDPQKGSHMRHTAFLVPFDSQGIRVLRPLHVFGYADSPAGHAEVVFENVNLPADAILGTVGSGFALAQSRLGPGRLHHCCRLIGHGERALYEAVRRGNSRKAFGRPLLDLGANSEKLSLGRVALHQATLAALSAAFEVDKSESTRKSRDHAKISREAIYALAVCKVACPHASQLCLDFAIQIHGGSGLSEDHPLAAMWVAARTLRLVDGPDEVHLQSICKMEKFRHLTTEKRNQFVGRSKL